MNLNEYTVIMIQNQRLLDYLEQISKCSTCSSHQNMNQINFKLCKALAALLAFAYFQVSYLRPLETNV